MDKVTLTLLEMHESGYMEQLDSKWIIRGGEKCETKNERTPATLGLTNMAGVFILVGAGIVGGIGLIVIEIVYKKHQTRKQRRLELARHAADKWRGAVEKRKTLRSTMQLQSRRVRANGREPFTTERGMLGLLESPQERPRPVPVGVHLPPPPPPAALRMRTAGHVRYLLGGDSDLYDITV